MDMYYYKLIFYKLEIKISTILFFYIISDIRSS